MMRLVSLMFNANLYWDQKGVSLIHRHLSSKYEYLVHFSCGFVWWLILWWWWWWEEEEEEREQFDEPGITLLFASCSIERSTHFTHNFDRQLHLFPFIALNYLLFSLYFSPLLLTNPILLRNWPTNQQAKKQLKWTS